MAGKVSPYHLIHWKKLISSPTALTSQSLLAWQSIYQLHPSSTAANADPTIHTCVVMGSRNGKSMIVLDGVNIIGYTDNFVKDGTLSWSTESSNAPLNGIISFEHKVVGDATNIGSRVMNAKLWKKGDPTPDAITHSGHDFFDDVSKFDGTYNTSLIDPVYGDESTGPQIQVAVNVAASAVNSATIDLNVNSDSGTPITVAKNLAADQNTVQWSNQNNVNVTWPDADTATWAQGYMNFSWNYKP
ncbi:hypothetical protein SISNIDRAFT_136256 [Sistotremastrum niveocremeum HHB9708]|uniref:Uncharacterized protein n=1 Tax=Sistotremastrum niveocremeum HHB9708 TaxID=1314777 RepID=A0A164ZYY1_9AGAM|nr:hypothetical protein SISNIDRAFT_136256 [Sistotremastrum niveocremeum HHB9708]